MVTKVNALTPMTTPAPNRSMDSFAFGNAAQTFAAELTAFGPAFNLRVSEINAAINELQALAGISMLYTFDSTITDADPGPGMLRLSNATQSAATVIRLDLLDVNGADQTAWLTSFGTGSSAIKGTLRVAHRDIASKFLAFNVTAAASPAGYRNITATPVAFSAASPFVAGDPLVVTFTRTGDGGGIAPADYQNQAYVTGTTAGTLTAYTLTPAQAISAYQAYQSFFVTFHAACGAAPTLTISGVGTPPNLVKQLGDGSYANLAAGDFPINHRSRITLLSPTQAWVEEMPPYQGKVRTFQTYLSGSGTWTRPAGCIAIKLRLIGGGGGGSGSGTASGGSGGAGGNTTFGVLQATGGNGGIFGAAASGNSASIGGLGSTVAWPGGTGCSTGTSNAAGIALPGGAGGVGVFGGGAGGALYTNGGGAAATNTGGGGSGGGGTAPGLSGTGGNAGNYIESFLIAPATSYTYAVGAAGTGGTAGTSGFAGGAGASGAIYIEEIY